MTRRAVGTAAEQVAGLTEQLSLLSTALNWRGSKEHSPWVSPDAEFATTAIRVGLSLLAAVSCVGPPASRPPLYSFHHLYFTPRPPGRLDRYRCEERGGTRGVPVTRTETINGRGTTRHGGEGEGAVSPCAAAVATGGVLGLPPAGATASHRVGRWRSGDGGERRGGVGGDVSPRGEGVGEQTIPSRLAVLIRTLAALPWTRRGARGARAPLFRGRGWRRGGDGGGVSGGRLPGVSCCQRAGARTAPLVPLVLVGGA